MPLTDASIIEDRIQSVTDLLDNYSVVERFKLKAASLVGRGKNTAG
jgi:hypothetical protein